MFFFLNQIPRKLPAMCKWCSVNICKQDLRDDLDYSRPLSDLDMYWMPSSRYNHRLIAAADTCSYMLLTCSLMERHCRRLVLSGSVLFSICHSICSSSSPTIAQCSSYVIRRNKCDVSTSPCPYHMVACWNWASPCLPYFYNRQRWEILM